ncbi:MAG: hypothetical protein ACXADC_07390 [Candidatus Thorarchaeota archaeon]|jgi:hypothetical protein
MQIDDILNQLTALFMDPIIQFIILAFILLAIVAVAARRRRGSSKTPVVGKMRRMMSDVEKERDIKVPDVKSRDSIITEMFQSEMKSVGLEPSTESGYIPVSYTPLARFLAEKGISNDIASAISTGLKEEETEEDVRNIIDAAAGTPDIELTPEEVAKAQDLAVEEWNRVRRAGGT